MSSSVLCYIVLCYIACPWNAIIETQVNQSYDVTYSLANVAHEFGDIVVEIASVYADGATAVVERVRNQIAPTGSMVDFGWENRELTFTAATDEVEVRIYSLHASEFGTRSTSHFVDSIYVDESVTPVLSLLPTDLIDESAGFAEYTLSLANAGPNERVPISYRTIGGTATPNADFEHVEYHTVEISTSEPTTIQIPLVNDTVNEFDEQFQFDIIDSPRYKVAILGRTNESTTTTTVGGADDELVYFTQNEITVYEVEGSFRKYGLPIRNTSRSPVRVTASLSSVDGKPLATRGEDYVLLGIDNGDDLGLGTVSSGDDEIIFAVRDDDHFDPNEAFKVTLTGADTISMVAGEPFTSHSVSIGDNSDSIDVLIVDNDEPPVSGEVLKLAISRGSTEPESDDVIHTVVVNVTSGTVPAGGITGTVSVVPGTGPGDDANDDDYTLVDSNQLSFFIPEGKTSAPIDFKIDENATGEIDEHFRFELVSANSSETVEIDSENDVSQWTIQADPTPTEPLAIVKIQSDKTVNEPVHDPNAPDPQTKDVTFTISLTGSVPDGETVFVDWRTYDGAGSNAAVHNTPKNGDYDHAYGTVEFTNAGTNEVTVKVNSDTLYQEEEENFFVEIHDVRGSATLDEHNDTVKVTITNNMDDGSVDRHYDMSCGCPSPSMVADPTSGGLMIPTIGGLSYFGSSPHSAHANIVTGLKTTNSPDAISSHITIRSASPSGDNQAPLNGAIEHTQSWNFSSATIDANRELLLPSQVDLTELPSGVYTVDLEVEQEFGAGQNKIATHSDRYILNNLQGSESNPNAISAGFAFTFLHRLHIAGDGVAAINGYNTASFYEILTGNQTTIDFETPNDTFSMLSFDNLTGDYTLTHKDSSYELFDRSGKHKESVDSFGNSTVYDYDPDGKLKTVTDPLNRTTTYLYDSEGMLEAIKDFSNRTVSFSRGPVATSLPGNSGKVGWHALTVTYPDPDSTVNGDIVKELFEYDADNRLRAYFDGKEETLFDYDTTTGILTTTTFADSAVWSVKPTVLAALQATTANPIYRDGTGAIAATITDGNQNETKVTVGDAGHVTKVVDALSNVTEYEHNQHGQVTNVILPDPDGENSGRPAIRIVNRYDYAGNLTERVVTNVATLDSEIESWINNTSASLPAHSTIERWEYGEFNLVEKYTDAIGQVTEFGIDPLVGATYTSISTQLDIPTDLPPAVAINPEAPWNNANSIYDVNNDGAISPIDALLVINFLGAELPSNPTGLLTGVPGPDDSFVDVNGDGFVSPLDALLIINAQATVINRDDGEVVSGRVTTQFTYNPKQGVAITGKVHDPKLPAGTLLTATDARGNTTTYDYQRDAFASDYGWLLREIFADDTDVHYTYDEFGNVRTFTDARENTTVFNYDQMDRLTSVVAADPYVHVAPGDVDPDATPTANQPVTIYEYDTAGNVKFVTDPNGIKSQYKYDGRHRIEEVTVALATVDQATTVFEYDDNGNTTKVTTPDGRSTTTERSTIYRYDELNRPVRIIAPNPDDAVTSLNSIPANQPVTEFRYDNVGNLLGVKDPNGNVTLTVYDKLGRPEFTVGENPSTQTPFDTDSAFENAYNVVANAPTALRSTRPVIEYDYDSIGQLIGVTTPAALVDPANPGNAPEGRFTEYQYDALGRLRLTIMPDPDGDDVGQDSSTMEYRYDNNGNLLAAIDGVGNVTRYQYEEKRDLLESTTDGNGHSTTYGYDDNGNVEWVQDSNGNRTNWTYDYLDRVKNETINVTGVGELTRTYGTFQANGDVDRPGYDNVGNLLVYKDRNDRVTRYEYDNQHRLEHEIWENSGSDVRRIEFDVDSAGQLYDVTDTDIANANSIKSKYTYDYDELGRAISSIMTIQGLTPNVTFDYSEYDAAGNLKKVKAKIGGANDYTNNYKYDNLHRATDIDQGGAAALKQVDLAYYLSGQTHTIDRANANVTTTFTYDMAGRLDTLTHAKGTTIHAEYDHGYDLANRLTSINNSAYATENEVFNYDRRDQLTTVTDSSNTVTGDHDYDENGNRHNDGVAPDAPFNRIKQDANFDYAYDNEGNLESKTRIKNDTNIPFKTVYEWDHRNRLTSVKIYEDNASTLTKTVTHEYDAFNQWISQTVTVGISTEETHFIHEGGQIVMQFGEDTNDNDVLTHRYLWGPGADNLLAVQTLVGSVGISWTLTDHLGSVRDVVNNAGNLTDHIVYDAFGNVTSGDLPILFGYTGRPFDSETGLQNNLNRWYDPAVGRWISEDPIGFDAGDANLYRYVGNSPTNAIDPTGLEACQVCSVGPDLTWAHSLPLPFPAVLNGIKTIQGRDTDPWGTSLVDYLLTPGSVPSVHYHYGPNSHVSDLFWKSSVMEVQREWLENGAATFCKGRCCCATYSSGVQTFRIESARGAKGLATALFDGITALLPAPHPRLELVGGHILYFEATIDCKKKEARFRGRIYNAWSIQSLSRNPWTGEPFVTRPARRVHLTVDFDETQKLP